MSDLYQILGVSAQASSVEITTAYRNLAKVYHPDKSTGNQDKFKDISQAYAILTDPRRRDIYDAQGMEGLELSERRRSRMGDDNGGVYKQSFNVPANNTLFNNIFEQFFGYNGDIPPLIQTLAIDIKDMYIGCMITLNYQRDVICPQCSTISGSVCGQCQGKKTIVGQQTIELQIDPGMTQITSPQMGNEYPNKTTGDLVVKLSVINQTPYEISGHHLKLRQHISLIEALNGVSKQVTFIDGTSIRLTTPSGQIVQTATPVIYKGSGLPIYSAKSQGNIKSHGDLYVDYHIVLPKIMLPEIKQQICALI